MKNTMKLAALVTIALFCSGCGPGWYDEANNSGDQFGELKISSDGVRYKIVEVEGHKFIATQGSYGYWQLAGPID